MQLMNRRDALKGLGGRAGGAAAVIAGGDAFWSFFGRPEPLEAAQAATRRGLPPLKITDVKVIRAQVGGNQLCNVKVYTSEPGLYGVGDGNHAERPSIVAANIEKFLKPLVVGRDVSEIEDIWQTAWMATYWRSAVDASNAIAAIDGALWDIMGKRAGMPVYDLLGGKLREGCRMFANAGGRTLQELEDSVRGSMANGYKHVRLRYFRERPAGAAAGPGGRVAGAPGAPGARGPAGGEDGPGRPLPTDAELIRGFVEPFEHLRKTIGWDLELCTEVHNNPQPTGGLMIAKALEPYRPFFIEDLFPMEDLDYYRIVRKQSAVGIAVGETFVNRQEWMPLVEERLIDYMRGHISAIGGLNMARKVAMMCEFFNVRTAWHGPGNVSPIGHAINLNLDLSLYNFGIGEGGPFSDQLKELYPGCPEIRNGLRYRANDNPGLGIDIDEKVAAKYPPTSPGGNRSARDADGAPRRP